MRLRLNKTLAALLIAVAAATGCGGGEGGESPVTPPPAGTGDLAPLVGNWTADSIVVSPKANPTVFREIVSADGVGFTFQVQSSGAYQATLNAFGQSSLETGTLRIQGNVILFDARTPVPGSSQGTFSVSGIRLIMEGDLILDFNQDGVADDVTARFVLSPF